MDFAMKFHSFNLWRLILSFAILSAAGCSAGITDTPTFISVNDNIPTHTPTVASTSQSLIGSIAFVHGSGNDDAIYVMHADSSGLKNLTPNILLTRTLLGHRTGNILPSIHPQMDLLKYTQ